MYLLLFEVAEHAISIAVIDAEHAPSSFYPGGIYWHYKLNNENNVRNLFKQRIFGLVKVNNKDTRKTSLTWWTLLTSFWCLYC